MFTLLRGLPVPHPLDEAPRWRAGGGVEVPQPPPDVIDLPTPPQPMPPTPDVVPEIDDPIPPGGLPPVQDPRPGALSG